MDVETVREACGNWDELQDTCNWKFNQECPCSVDCKSYGPNKEDEDEDEDED